MMMNLMTVLVKKVFISSKPSIVCLLCPPPCGPFSIQEIAVGGLSYKVKKNVPWHILAPRRGCLGNHLPLRRVRILVERFLSYGNEVSYTIKNARRNSLPPDAHILPGFSRKTVLFFKDRAARFEPKPISVTFTVNSARHPCGTREILFSAALFPT